MCHSNESECQIDVLGPLTLDDIQHDISEICFAKDTDCTLVCTKFVDFRCLRNSMNNTEDQGYTVAHALHLVQVNNAFLVQVINAFLVQVINAFLTTACLNSSTVKL